MLSRFFRTFVLMISVSFAGAALADESAKPAITGTIQSQMDALMNDDFKQAFSYASPMIKQMFGTPEIFGSMVARGYPMVHRPSDIRFLELREIAGALYQKVQVRDAAGQIHILDYQMIQGENGWQINGVQLLKAAGLSA